jgi:hypothetical protein
MNTIKIYANYGLLAHEKETVFSTTASDSCNAITVQLPENWKAYKSDAGIFLESPWGWSYTPEEVLQSRNNEPWIFAIDKDGKQYERKLKII